MFCFVLNIYIFSVCVFAFSVCSWEVRRQFFMVGSHIKFKSLDLAASSFTRERSAFAFKSGFHVAQVQAWSQVYYAIDNGLELLTFMSLSPYCRGYRYGPLPLVDEVLRIKPRALCILRATYLGQESVFQLSFFFTIVQV